MQNIYKINNNGFSLVEVIIYIALFAMLMTAVLSFSLSTIGAHAKTSSMEEVLSGAREIERIINYYIKEQAAEISYPSPGSNNNSLRLLTLDGSDVLIYLDNGRLMIKIDSAEAKAVTANELLISDLSIYNYGVLNEFDSITLACQINFASMDSLEFVYNYDFKMTVNVRN